jgi:hypothetical protein
MLRLIAMSLLLSVALGAVPALAQTKKVAGPARQPTPKDVSISITAFMRDANKNELMLVTRIWPDNPDYNAQALQRLFALMKALEPGYKKDDDVAYTWQTKAKVTKCGIYLESDDASTKTGTGAVVGCEPNGVSSIPVMSLADPKRPSGSQDAKHLADVLDLLKKQMERAKAAVSR